MNTRNSKLLWTSLAVVATAVMYYFGTALEPEPWLQLLMWVAPLPVLLVAPRLRARSAFGAAALAWALGELQVLWYFTNNLEMPIPLAIGWALVTSAAFAGCVVLFRALVLRRRFWAAVVAAPAAWVCAEYGMSLVAADDSGNWWSLAYTQANFIPVLQTVSIAGTAGLAFLLFAVPSGAAALFAPGATRSSRALVGGTVAVLLAASLGYGFMRPTDDGEPLRAAALALPASVDSLPIDSSEAKRLIDDYRDRIAELGDDNVSVVVLPEKTFKLTDADRGEYFGRWSKIAEKSETSVVVGMTLKDGGKFYNVAAWFPSDGSKPTVYRKNHLIGGVEDWITPGSDTTMAPGHDNWGMAICKDLDYVELAARYREAGATVMFVPALEFDVDGWSHSRVAITRGVEQGFSMIRTGQQGRMTISDQYGNVLADDKEAAVAAVGTNGAATFYARFGDWLVWLSIAITAVGMVLALRRRTGEG
ncbi:MAG: nitrilase-related carbon-nitrogen hydrolase [Stackebrandtia sp.]